MPAHIIHRTRFDFSISNQKKAFEVQNQMQAILYEKLLPQMDSLFSDLVPEGVVCQLERLEVDLGKVRLQNIESSILEAVNQQMREQIEAQIAVIKSGISVPQLGEIKWSSKPKTKVEALIHFLETGLLPWWSKGKQAIDLATEILAHDASELLLFLEKNASTQVWNRIAKQFPKTVLQSITKSKDTAKFEVLQKITNDLSFLKINTSKSNFKSIEVTFLKLLLEGGNDWSPFYLQIFKAHFEKIKSEKGQKIAAKEAANFVATIQNLPSNSPVKSWFEKISSSKLWAETASTNIEQQEFSELDLLPFLQKTHSSDSKKSTQKEQKLVQKIEEILKNGILVNHAGIVILAPFLSPFFKKIGLVKGKDFVSEAAKEKAVLMCDYLVNGATEIMENETMIHKLLCGFPLQQSIERELKISEKEQIEVEDLLKSVIQHWGALGQTSIGGLQSAFLKREGRLIDENRFFSLKIERLGRDVLLEKLPWSFGLIRLPWMTKPIEVEW